MSETVAGTGSEAAAAGSVAEAAAESASESGASGLAAARESGTPPKPSHNQTAAFRKTEEEEREARNGCRQNERKLRGVFFFFLW